jgi:hypothetical protein
MRFTPSAATKKNPVKKFTAAIVRKDQDGNVVPGKRTCGDCKKTIDFKLFYTFAVDGCDCDYCE